MSTLICYFSGTGNSLAVARDIATGLGGALAPMAAGVNPRAVAAADAIGLVFPAYMAQLNGVPLAVQAFVSGLRGIEGTYLFAVCTCGGHEDFNALPALKRLERLVRAAGGKVSAEFAVRLPMNTLDYSHIPVPIDQDRGRMLHQAEIKVREICATVGERTRSPHRAAKTVLNWTMGPLYRLLQTVYYKDLREKSKELADRHMDYRELVRLSDRSIFADDNCRGCATCARVCPVMNIVVKDGKPSWLHRCEACLACAEWCPQNAIHHGFRKHGATYHHPGVTLEDMAAQARAGRATVPPAGPSS